MLKVREDQREGDFLKARNSWSQAWQSRKILMQGKWSITQEIVMGNKKWDCQTMEKVKTERKGVRSNGWSSQTQKKRRVNLVFCYLCKATKRLLSAKLYLNAGMLQKSKRRCKRRQYVWELLVTWWNARCMFPTQEFLALQAPNCAGTLYLTLAGVTCSRQWFWCCWASEPGAGSRVWGAQYLTDLEKVQRPPSCPCAWSMLLLQPQSQGKQPGELRKVRMQLKLMRFA